MIHQQREAWRNIVKSIERGHTRTFDQALAALEEVGGGEGWQQTLVAKVVAFGSVHQLKKVLARMDASSLPQAMAQALSAKSWDLLPVLLAAGAPLPPPAHKITHPFAPMQSLAPWEQVVAHALGSGSWPHPDLWCPTVLQDVQCAKIAAQALFSGVGGRKGSGLDYFHLQKLTALAWHPATPVFMGSALGQASKNINALFMLQDLPHRQEYLVDLMQAGLLSPEAALRATEGGANATTVREWIIAAQWAILEAAAPTPTALRAKPRL